MAELENILNREQALKKQKDAYLEKALASGNKDKIAQAWGYLSGQEGKSVLARPDEVANASGYRERSYQLDYTYLRRMASVPLLRAIINTRQDQVSSFARYSTNPMRAGWEIRPKRRLFEDAGALTSQQKRDIESIASFLENTGAGNKKFILDNFNQFLRKITKDSLELDQLTFEVVWNKAGKVSQFIATDGTTYRYLLDVKEYPKKRGLYPHLVQVVDNNLIQEFYPYELCFASRNSSTDINKHRYGESELEILVRTITWLLYGDEYNGRFFSQGSMPKGILHIKNKLTNQSLDAFRSQWKDQVGGLDGAWRMPIMGGDMEFLNMQQSNKDMEFARWNEYLVKVVCAVYKIDPMEIGFAQKTPGLQKENEGEIFNQSQDRGLKPLLRFIESQINKHLITEMTEDYEFKFTGLDNEDEKSKIEDRLKKLQYKTLDETREDEGLPPLETGGDVVTNSVWIQKVQADAFGGEESNEFVEGEFGEGEEGGGEEESYLSDDQIDKINEAGQGLEEQ